MLSTLDPGDLPLVMDECINSAENQVNFVLQPYVAAILAATMPMKLPSGHYGAVGAYHSYQIKLKAINSYEPLR